MIQCLTREFGEPKLSFFIIMWVLISGHVADFGGIPGANSKLTVDSWNP